MTGNYWLECYGGLTADRHTDIALFQPSTGGISRQFVTRWRWLLFDSRYVFIKVNPAHLSSSKSKSESVCFFFFVLFLFKVFFLSKRYACLFDRYSLLNSSYLWRFNGIVPTFLKSRLLESSFIWQYLCLYHITFSNIQDLNQERDIQR